MIITTKFDIKETVLIPNLHKDLKGMVTDILITSNDIKYWVRYFWESKPQDVCFYEFELVKEVK